MKVNRIGRKKSLIAYRHLYSRLENIPFDECWYCGSLRECLDHCPPLDYLQYIDTDVFRKSGGKFSLIPSCNSCNTLLGNKKLLSPNERISWLLGAYTKLFDKAYYGWSEDEVKEMGYNFKVMIGASMKKANSYIDKVRSIEQRIIDIKEW